MILWLLAEVSALTNCADASSRKEYEACLERRDQPEARLRASTQAERQEVIRYFNSTLKDGPSARWQWDGTWRDGWVCGKVNAKNSYGGYTGWQFFAYRAGYGVISEDGRNDWHSASPAPCLRPGLEFPR